MSLPSLCLCSWCYECMSRLTRWCWMQLQLKGWQDCSPFQVWGCLVHLKSQARGVCTYERHLNPLPDWSRKTGQMWSWKDFSLRPSGVCDVLIQWKSLSKKSPESSRCKDDSFLIKPTMKARLLFFSLRNQACKLSSQQIHPQPLGHVMSHFFFVPGQRLWLRGWKWEKWEKLISDVGGLFVKMSVHYQVEWKMTRSTYNLPWRIINHFSQKKATRRPCAMPRPQERNGGFGWCVTEQIGRFGTAVDGRNPAPVDK